MSTRHLFLIAYDSPCPKRQTRFRKTLKLSATGGQKSAYECWLTVAELQETMQTLRSQIDREEDRLFVLKLDPRARTHALGTATTPSNEAFLLIA